MGKTPKPFRYDLNQIPYTVEVTNRFEIRSGRVPEELWTEVCNIVQEAVTKIISKEKKYKKEKWLSEKVLQIAEGRRETKKQGGKGKVYPTECCIPENCKVR